MKIEEPKTKIENIPDLNNIDFGILKFPNQPGQEFEQRKDLKVLFDGIVLDLHIESSMLTGKYGWMHLDINLNISKNSLEIANINLAIVKEKIYFAKVSTEVENKSREINGLGRTLWEISLKLIQKIANEFNISVKHEVVKDPRNGLSGIQWNRLFLPLLEKHGYKKTHADAKYMWEKWERTYLPNKL